MTADDQKTNGATEPTTDATSSIPAETEVSSAPQQAQPTEPAAAPATEQAIEPTAGQADAQADTPAATKAVEAAKVEEKATDGDGDNSKPAQQDKKKPRVHPRDAIQQFAAAWPEAFSTDPKAVKPLAIGILQQILAERPPELDGLNSRAIRTAMKFYTSRLSYHFAMKDAEHRVDLKGEPAEPVDDKARAHSEEQIKAIHAQRDAKRAAQAGKESGKEPGKEAGDENKPRRPRKASGKPAAARKGAKTAPRGADSKRRPSKSTSDQRKESQPDPALKNMSMEEKLERLAQRFGQDGVK